MLLKKSVNSYGVFNADFKVLLSLEAIRKLLNFIVSDTEIYAQPLHPYTQALLSAIPVPDPTFKKKQIILEGDLPSPVNPPSGCRLSSRCPYVMPICKEKKPELMNLGPNQSAACHLFSESKLEELDHIASS